jgi:sRNA-binding regulator protein Hfq
MGTDMDRALVHFHKLKKVHFTYKHVINTIIPQYLFY